MLSVSVVHSFLLLSKIPMDGRLVGSIVLDHVC